MRKIGHLLDKEWFIGKGCGCLEELREDLSYTAGHQKPGHGPIRKPRNGEKPAVEATLPMFDTSAYTFIPDVEKDGGSKRRE